MEEICESISFNKAISCDLFSDVILKDPVARQAVCTKFKDLWSNTLNNMEESLNIWTGRVIPLNKVHPEIPDSSQFRPIVVQSIILKILEARFLPKLNKYMIERLTPSQTGFVKGQGIFVNLYRVFDRITLRTKEKKHPIGLFVDFKSAYNHVKHDSLFERLKTILEVDEIKFLRTIYQRLSLSLGTKSFHPNTGVSQGSILSPALFNIYLEPLLLLVHNSCKIDMLDIFVYADDLMILCQDIEQLERCIDILNRWALDNNLPINHNKSGIIEFQARRGKNVSSGRSSIKNFPIVTEYKYLGCWINKRLTLKPQLDFIQEKSNYIKYKLFPMLSSCSLSHRKNMWQTFIVPLFEFTLPLLSYETGGANIRKLEILLRKTFRSFTFLAPKTALIDVDALMGYNLCAREKAVRYVSEKKWETRLEGRLYDAASDLTLPTLEWRLQNIAKHLPKEAVTYSNLLCALCPRCPAVHEVSFGS